MSVYVDDMLAGFRRMQMCHMIADSRDELDEMADAIGIQRKWIQYPGTYKEHYDICKSKRVQALQRGAIEISLKDLGRRMRIRCLRVSRGKEPPER